ncbi:MAG: glycerate dehydrogenase [Anaerolineaceae bacterium]|nr:glycerate dehydrogenase [Anaerolineaceae bacterium]
MFKGLFILGANNYERIYGPAEQRDIRQLVDIYAPPQTPDDVKANPAILQDADVIFSGWGGPRMDADFLAAAPNLKAVFYGAGSIRGLVTDEFWARDILITSAAAANAVPVAEYTISQVLFCLKHGWHHALEIKRTGQRLRLPSMPGAYGATVGLVSLGLIGRRVAELLRLFDVNIIAYDPFVPVDAAAELNVQLVGLEDVFRQADVVSLHTPWLPETVGMITGEHFALMKPNASFINTARGAVVREDEMIAVLQQRPDLYAILDVTYPEPPVEGSPLYSLPNVVLTPHIAGSQGPECYRMGRYMVDELTRYLNEEPLHYGITQTQFARMA